MSLCGTGIYANDVLCEVIEKLDEHHAIALGQLTLANDAIAALQDSAVAEMSGISAIDYDANTNIGVYSAPDPATEQDFSTLEPTPPTYPDAPTIDDPDAVDAAPAVPPAYVLPDADVALISDADIEAIYNKAEDRLARVGVKAERDAVYRASAMGIGMASAALTVGLAAAEEDTNQRTSDAALEHSTQEGIWKREDAKTIHGLQVQNWPLKPQMDLDSYSSEEGLEVDAYKAKMDARTRGYADVVGGLNGIYGSQVQWALGYLGEESKRYSAEIDNLRANISSEAEKRGWSELEMRDVLEQSDKATGYALQKAQAILEVNRSTEEAVAQLMVGMVQGVFSAADYGLSGRGSQSVTDSV